MKRYLHAVQWLDWGVVYDLSATPPGQKKRHEFVSMMNDKFEDNGLYKIVARRTFEKITFTISPAVVRGDEATVPVVAKSPIVKRELALEFKLRNFGGVWKIEPIGTNPLETIGATTADNPAGAVPASGQIPTGVLRGL